MYTPVTTKSSLSHHITCLLMSGNLDICSVDLNTCNIVVDIFFFWNQWTLWNWDNTTYLTWPKIRTSWWICLKKTSKPIKKLQWVEPVSLTFHSVLRKLYTEPSICCFLPSLDSFGKAVSEKIFLRNRPIRNKNCLWRQCSFHVHLATQFQEKIFLEITRKKNYLWWPCLLRDRSEMNNLYRGLSIDASCQVSVHLAKWFQRRFYEIHQSETRIACGSHVY